VNDGNAYNSFNSDIWLCFFGWSMDAQCGALLFIAAVIEFIIELFITGYLHGRKGGK